MNPFTESVRCSVCGELGMATLRDASELWLGAEIRHRDPAVCAANLARRKRELDAREEALKEKGQE